MSGDDIDVITQRLSEASVAQSVVLSYAGKGFKLNNASDAADIIADINACKAMKALRLDGNTIGVDAAKSIAKALEKHPEFERALWSDMFTGRLKTEIPDALRYLGSAIMLAGAKLVELDLSDNALGPNGMKGLLDFLKSESCFSLQELRLHNNGLGVTGGKMLARCLLECYEKSVEASSPLALRVFVSGRGRLEDEGSIALSEAFKAMGSLEEVQMPQNGINKAGIAALASAFAVNKNLKHINLNDNTFTKTGAFAMAKTLPRLKKLEILNFGDCLIRTKGAESVARSITRLSNLKVVNLSFNEIRKSGGVAVAESMAYHEHLQKLELGGNNLGETGIDDVMATMREVDRDECLGSLSDDDGSDEEDHDTEGDDDQEDVEPEEEEEGEENTDVQLKVTGVSITPKQELTAKDFLQFPSPTKLRQLGKDASGDLVSSLGEDISDLEKVMAVFMKLCSVVTSDDNSTKTAACQCTDFLFEEALRNHDKNTESTFANTLLVYLGLMKSEDRKFKASSSIDGALIVLSHAVKQSYFPQAARDILQFCLGRPHPALNTCTKSKSEVLKALFQF